MNRSRLLRDYRIYIVCGAAAFAAVLWAALFFPQRNVLLRLQRERAVQRQSMKELEALTSRYGGDPSAVIQALTAEVAAMNERFPEDETASVSGISLAARKIGLEMVSLSAGEKEIYLDSDGKKAVFYGREVYTVAVSFRANGTFSEFYRFLEYLYSGAPAMVNVEDFRLVKDKSRPGMLEAEINMKIFLLL